MHVDGVRVGHRCWNRLQGGTDVDLTADQFRPGGPRRHREQDELLRSRVLSALDGRNTP